MSKGKYTKLKKFKIKKFRRLEDIDVDFGKRVTLICGKNGTSKSTILGMAAQIFNFSKDFSVPSSPRLDYKTITGKRFKSHFADHFRFSKKYDISGSMELGIEVYDAYFKKDIDELELGVYKYKDRDQARPVVRKNLPSLTGEGNRDRNVTHPVIYLSLSRLLPISQRTVYSQQTIKYLEENAERFRSLSCNILGRQDLTKVTATSGDVQSAVSHADNYDQDSVSVGEDNVGQIVLALMSFEKLKKDYKDYKGGMLLIDEADAGLFPAAQKRLIDELDKISRSIGLQVIMTSHSPTMIEYVKEKSEQDRDGNFRTVYLTDTYGSIETKHDWGWERIYADLNTKLYKIKKDGLIKPDMYFEDQEAYDFHNAIIKRTVLRSSVSPVKDVKLGSGNYLNLIKNNVKEFSSKSVIVFDGDVKGSDAYKNCVKLPGELPPDQLLFEFLFKLSRDDPFYVTHPHGFSKDVFFDISKNIFSVLEINESQCGPDFSLSEAIKSAGYYKSKNGDNPIRKYFKDFYNHDDMQSIVSKVNKGNPFYYWRQSNEVECEEYRVRFSESVKFVLVKGFGVNRAELEIIK